MKSILYLVTRSSWKIVFLLGNVHVLVNLCTTYIIYVKQTYNLIDMGFMDRFKESDEKKQERYDNVISTYNVFEGIKFKVIFPSKELKIEQQHLCLVLWV